MLRALLEECASDRLLLLHDNHRFVVRDHYIHTSSTVFAFYLHHLRRQPPVPVRTLCSMYTTHIVSSGPGMPGSDTFPFVLMSLPNHPYCRRPHKS